MTWEQRIDAETQAALDGAWHRDSASASLDRWLDLSDKAGCHMPDEYMPDLVRVFGASWYFTRFLFFRGEAAALLFEPVSPDQFQHAAVGARLRSVLEIPDREAALGELRILKNETMLQILLADLRGVLSLADVERALTCLAEQTLNVALALYSQHGRDKLEEPLGVLGMGRMAGWEMNYGSDLDLIFLHPGESQDMFVQISTLVRALLRGISTAAPSGILYEIDMRLRPHGSAGALITSRQSFEEHHADGRDIWERQMMTRCRPVADPHGLAGETLAAVMPHVYADYDVDHLRREIRIMRARVEHELGCPAGRYELKRGPGGIMDIDFICHYLQLAHGHADSDLRSASTRIVLEKFEQRGLLSADAARQVREAYDFLKQVESRLRVFDMKSVSSFPREAAGLIPLSRAMDFHGETGLAGAEAFLQHYKNITGTVRGLFDEILPAD